MSTEAGVVVVPFKGDFSGLNREVNKHLDPIAKNFGSRFGKALGPVMSQQAKHLRTFGTAAKYATVGAAGLAAYGLKDVVKAGSEFEKQMSVNNAISEAHGKQLAQLEKQSLKLGKSTFFSAKEAAEAQGELIKGGLKVQQVLGGGLPAALSLAEAGELDLATAAETTVNAMKLFGLEGKEASSVADMLATAANKTTADVLDFAMALKQGGSVTKLAGYDMNETVTILEALAEAGIKNSDAGTSMKTAVIQLLKPSEKQAKLQKELGLNLITSNGHLKDAAGISKELHRATDGMTKAERAKTLATLAGTDGVRTLNALYEQTPGELRKLEQANAKQGTAQEIAKKKMDNFAGAWEQFKGSMETTEIQIYKGIQPALQTLTGEAEKAADKVGRVFENKNLTEGQKFERSAEIIADELGRMWDKYDLTDKLTELLDKAIPAVAETAGHLGLEFAAAFGKGFLKASPFTKVVMAAWAIHFIGGKAPFVAAAKFAAKQFGITFAAESAATVAAGSLAPTAATTVATASGARWLGTDTAPAGRAAGAFGERKLLEDAGLVGAASVGSRVKGLLAKSMTVLGGVAGGYFAAEFGARVVEGVTGKDLLENQDLKTALTHGFNTKGVLRTEVDALQEAKGFNPDLAQKQIEVLESSFKETLGKIRSAAAIGLSGINHSLKTGLDQADRLWIQGTRPWRQHTSQAMQAAVDEIRKGIHSGSIPVEQGQKRINKLLSQISLRKGSDPFGLAKATTESFQKSNAITSAGVQRWARQLDQMPKAAREKSIEATNSMLRAWAQGHPKLEAQINNLTDFERRKFGGTNAFLERDTANAMATLAKSASEGATNVGGALSNIFDNLANALAAVGASKIPTFSLSTLSTASQYHHTREEQPIKKQRGGPIGTFTVPGAGSGDKVPMMLPPGSFIENREAARLPFQAGGLTPVILEPKERVWLPGAVQKAGLSNLQARNRAFPRFQTGGLAEGRLPHPGLTGPEPTRELGQSAIDKGWKAAQAYLRKHMEPARVLKMLRFAEAEADKGYPYVFGGGHGSFSGPYDCSGFVSAILHAGGFLSAPMSVQQGSGLYTLGEAGPGKFFTWGVRGTSGANAHTMIAVKAPGGKFKYFEAGGSGGGAHENAGWDGSFQFRHMPGFQRGGQVPEKAQEAIKKYGQEAFNPQNPHFVGWGYQRGGLIPAVQKLQKGGWVKTGYTIYSGSGPGAGGDLQKGDGYAELGTATSSGVGTGSGFIAKALGRSGELPMEFPLDVKVGSKVAKLYKRDRGYGQGDSYYSIDIHSLAWPELGLSMANGKGNAFIRPSNDKLTEEEEKEHTYKEDVPNNYHGCSTQSLHFPSVPKNIDGIEREIKRWRTENNKFKRAINAAGKEKRPAVAQELRHNKADIENHLRDLHNAKVKAKREIAQKRFTRRLQKKFAKLTGHEAAIEAAQATYERRGQDAEQIVDLEPLQPELPRLVLPTKAKGETDEAFEKKRQAAERSHEEQREHSERDYVGGLTAYVEGREKPAYESVLQSEADWRNTILTAQQAAAGNYQKQNFLGGFEGAREDRIIALVQEERDIETFREMVKDDLEKWHKKVKAEVDKWHHDHPKSPLPDWLRKRQDTLPPELQKEVEQRDRLLDKLPSLKFQERESRDVLGKARELFYPGKAGQGARGIEKIYRLLSDPQVPAVGSGSFEESLREVQGIHWPEQHEFLKSLPAAREATKFGGAIWDTQAAINELGLKVKEAAASIQPAEFGEESTAGTEAESQPDSELVEIWKQIAKEANQRYLVSETLNRTIGQSNTAYPYAGKFHSGGTVLGPPGQERLGLLKTQERIRTPEQEAALAQSIAAGRSGGGGSVGDVAVYMHGDGRATVDIGGQQFTRRVEEINRRTTPRGRVAVR